MKIRTMPKTQTKTKRKTMKLENFEWGTLTSTEHKLVREIAEKAIKRNIKTAKALNSQPFLKTHGFINLAMDLEVCHVKHFKLRLKEMAKTKDYFSFMHDIYMIVNSIDRETYGWNGIGMPRFSA